MVALCQVTASSNSATEILNPWRSFLFEAADHLPPVLQRVRLLDVQFKRERNNGHGYPSAVCAAAINSSGFIAARELHWTNPLRQDASPRNCRQGEHSGWWKRLVLRGPVGRKRWGNAGPK
jgi:hypothetical protein